MILAAERLSATVRPGAHGLRRPGPGEEFWQYRPAAATDDARAVDWRRSARSDLTFVRDRERVSPRAAHLWVSAGAGMDWRGRADRPTKADRARLLALALGLLLLRGGERVGVLGHPATAGRTQAERIARDLAALPADAADADAPPTAPVRGGETLILISDFMGDPAPVEDTLARAAGAGATGALLQVLDPDEEGFPYAGAVLFRSASGRLSHDTRDAGGLRDAYLDRLAARRARLDAVAQAAGFRFGIHLTASPPAEALLWLAAALEA
nr:DUF58 domain-containing protein [Paracoccus sp. S-4012]